LSGLVLASVRSDIANYVATLFTVYIVLILIRIVLSWFPRIPYYRWLDLVLRFVNDVTDPYLNIFRRFIPPIRLGPGALDISPIIAILVLTLVARIVVPLISG
jgi:YggT family protein